MDSLLVTMKHWLLNILACPIDKHHPLDAYLFTWETTEEEIRKIASEAGQPNTHFKERYKHLAKQMVDGTISPPSLKAVEDLSSSEDTKSLLTDVVMALDRLGFKEGLSEEQLQTEFSEEVDVFYRYLNLLEVEEGLLVCPECGRWYPIGSAVETIPELLPDDLRERDRDLGWLVKWREQVPGEVLEGGKPFSLAEP